MVIKGEIGMRQFEKNIVRGAMIALALGGTAMAQPLSAPLNYGVKTMSFELWCQQTQRYSSDRCQERRPEDVKAFEDYRAVVERYELQFLKQQEREREVRSFSTRDPSQTIFDKQDGLNR